MAGLDTIRPSSRTKTSEGGNSYEAVGDIELRNVLEAIYAELRIMNIHLASLSDTVIREEDIDYE